MEPLLAETFEQPDALTYVYTLRSGITFHNGDPLTVDDVIASIARVRDPEVAGPMGWMYDPVDTIEKVDESTLQITLTAPSALYRYVAATTAGHVIPASAIEEFGLDLAINPVGTGPYKFVKYDTGSEIELEKNTEYWQEGKPYLRQGRLQDRSGRNNPGRWSQERRSELNDPDSTRPDRSR